jgi:CRP/FNR family transcriptional regulator
MIEVNYFRQRLLIDQSKNRNFLNLFTASHDFLYSRLMALGTKSLHGRLATALLYLNEDRFHHEDIFSHITRTDLAELSAMSIESLIRILKEFKQEDLIKLEGKRIEILNLNKMQSVSRNN